MIGYSDANYYKTSYLFTYEGIAISWRSVKQTLVATSSNHYEIIAIHKASRDCIWLRLIIKLIKEKYRFSTIKDSLAILLEDNVICISKLRGGYIKGDKTKYISQKFFYTH